MVKEKFSRKKKKDGDEHGDASGNTGLAQQKFSSNGSLLSQNGLKTNLGENEPNQKGPIGPGGEQACHEQQQQGTVNGAGTDAAVPAAGPSNGASGCVDSFSGENGDRQKVVTAYVHSSPAQEGGKSGSVLQCGTVSLMNIF